MQSGLKNIDIHIDKLQNDKIISKNSRIQFKIIKDVLNKNFTIVDIDYGDFNLLSDILSYLNGRCSITGFTRDLDNTLNARRMFNKHNVVFFNDYFLNNDLKNNIADIIIGKNIIGSTDKSLQELKEINRVLKPKGNFFFLELISFNKPWQGFKNYFKRQKEHIFNTIMFDFPEKLKLLKNCQYEIKIVGNGNFYFDSQDVKSLQNFCDVLGYKSEDRVNILSDILAVIIKGTIPV